MGGRMSRNKGASAEREVFKILNDECGVDLKRNLEQYQDSDADAHIAGWCIEIKRQETLSLKTWWGQVCEVAKVHNEIPVLLYRQSRKPWRAVIPFHATSTFLSEYCHDCEGFHLPNNWMDFDQRYEVDMQPLFTTMLSESLHMETMLKDKEVSH